MVTPINDLKFKVLNEAKNLCHPADYKIFNILWRGVSTKNVTHIFK